MLRIENYVKCNPMIHDVKEDQLFFYTKDATCILLEPTQIVMQIIVFGRKKIHGDSFLIL